MSEMKIYIQDELKNRLNERTKELNVKTSRFVCNLISQALDNVEIGENGDEVMAQINAADKAEPDKEHAGIPMVEISFLETFMEGFHDIKETIDSIYSYASQDKSFRRSDSLLDEVYKGQQETMKLFRAIYIECIKIEKIVQTEIKKEQGSLQSI